MKVKIKIKKMKLIVKSSNTILNQHVSIAISKPVYIFYDNNFK